MIPANTNLNRADLGQWPKKALIAAVLGAIVCVVGVFSSLSEFLLAYLVAFVFWSNLALGSLALLMIQYLSGGAWGLVMRRVLESGSRMVYWIPLLWLPVFLAVLFHTNVYEWTHADIVKNDAMLQAKAPYLNVPFWIARSAIYFVIWIGLAFFLNRWSRLQDETGDQRYLVKMRTLSGPGVVLYALTVTFASVDWMMSLEPHWYSTIYGALLAVGQLLGGLCFATAVITLLARFRPMSEILQKRHMHDYGKLMLGFTMLWAYLNFSQLLIIWSANLAEEIPWYLNRLRGGWQYVGAFLIAFHFVVPFLLLLSRALKKNPRTLIGIACWIIFMRSVDLYYQIVPSAAAAHAELHGWRWLPFLFGIGAMLAVGGFWLWRYLTELTSRPLLPLNDPYIEEALDPHGGGH